MRPCPSSWLLLLVSACSSATTPTTPPTDGGVEASSDSAPASDDSPAFPVGELTVSPAAACPGSAGGTCTTVTVRCSGLPGASAVPDAVAIVKVLTPQVKPIGTIVMSTGNDAEAHWGRTLFEGNGAEVVQDVRAKGYTTAQIAWRTDGVNVGVGGMKLLSCRYATVAKWIFDGTGTNPKVNPAIHAAGTPFGATGNSGGGGIIAYGLAFHGLGQIMDRIVLSSSPIVFDLVHACVQGAAVTTSCGQAPATDAYEEPTLASARLSIDRSYGWLDANPTANAPCQNHDAAFTSSFKADSLATNPDARVTFPRTDIVQILGSSDGSSAKPIATAWFQALLPAGGRVRQTGCVNAPHTLTATAEGRDAIKAEFTVDKFQLHH